MSFCTGPTADPNLTRARGQGQFLKKKIKGQGHSVKMMIVSNRMGKITCKLNESLVMIILLYIHVIKMKKKSMFYFFYFKMVPWFSPLHKEGNELCIIYPLIHGSVLITFTVRVTKQHPVNISFLKKNYCCTLLMHNQSCCLRIEIKHSC